MSNLQKGNNTSQSVIVQFKENIDESSLNKLSDVTAVEKLETGTWKLKTANPENVRKQLLELSLKNNLNIVSLQSENNSLENIFRELTSTK